MRSFHPTTDYCAIIGTPLAVVYAKLFYAFKQGRFLDSYNLLIFYKRYISDIFGIWIPNTDKDNDKDSWSNLQSHMINYYELKWTLSPPSTTEASLRLPYYSRYKHTYYTLQEASEFVPLYTSPLCVCTMSYFVISTW